MEYAKGQIFGVRGTEGKKYGLKIADRLEYQQINNVNGKHRLIIKKHIDMPIELTDEELNAICWLIGTKKKNHQPDVKEFKSTQNYVACPHCKQKVYYSKNDTKIMCPVCEVMLVITVPAVIKQDPLDIFHQKCNRRDEEFCRETLRLLNGNTLTISAPYNQTISYKQAWHMIEKVGKSNISKMDIGDTLEEDGVTVSINGSPDGCK